MKLIKTKNGFPSTRSELETISAERLEFMKSQPDAPPYFRQWASDELFVRASRARTGSPNTPNGRPRRPA